MMNYREVLIELTSNVLGPEWHVYVEKLLDGE